MDIHTCSSFHMVGIAIFHVYEYTYIHVVHSTFYIVGIAFLYIHTCSVGIAIFHAYKLHSTYHVIGISVCRRICW